MARGAATSLILSELEKEIRSQQLAELLAGSEQTSLDSLFNQLSGEMDNRRRRGLLARSLAESFAGLTADSPIARGVQLGRSGDINPLSMVGAVLGSQSPAALGFAAGFEGAKARRK